MRKHELYDYIRENFILNGTSRRLIYDALNYIKNQDIADAEKEITMIDELIGSIGISKLAIAAFVLPKATIEDVRVLFEDSYDGPDIRIVDDYANFLVSKNKLALKQCEELHKSGALFFFNCTEQELEDWKNNTYSNNYER